MRYITVPGTGVAAELRSAQVRGGLAGAVVIGGRIAQSVQRARADGQLPGGSVVAVSVRRPAGARRAPSRSRCRRGRRTRTLAASGRAAQALVGPAVVVVMSLLGDRQHLGLFERAGHLDARPQLLTEFELLRVLESTVSVCKKAQTHYNTLP